MKKKYFLRGLGAGIMLSAVVTAVSVVQNNSVSDEEIRTRAKQLGMVEAEQNTKEKEQKETKAAATENPKKTKKAKKTEEPTVLPDVTATPEAQKFVDTGKKAGTYATEQPKQTEKPEATKKPAATKKPQSTEKKYISVTIEAGMWSDEISKKFKELGLVDNAEAFDDFLCDNGYASMIKVGVYEVPTNATYTEIANIITK